MSSIGTTRPDDDPALQRLIVASRAQLAMGPIDRERVIESLTAALFLVAAVALALAVDAGRSFDPALAAALVCGYALATRVEFRMGSGWTYPTQLVFVPMLFLLPTPVTPLLVAAALVIGRAPEYLRGTVHIGRVVPRIADAWYSIWPALVLSLAGATSPDWSDVPIYAAALGAQIGLDFLTTSLRVWLELRVRMRTLVDELRAIYLVDAVLAPTGLLAAFASTENEWALLCVLPLIGLIAIFAREREARIENALALSSAYRGTAHLLGEVLSTTHEYTGTHSRSVVVLAHQVADAMDLDERTLREVEFGALLHDVGKMAVPNEILNKPGKLTPVEWEVMRSHTREGEEMLNRIGGVLAEAGTIVRSHHERFDGTGYPDGLAGEEIPIAARVIAACDAFNAMVTDRPYRAALPPADAIAELRTHAGTQFDPAVVDVLIGIVHPETATAGEQISETEQEAPQPRLGALAS